MNRIYKAITIFAALPLLFSCKGTWLMYDTEQTPVVYFMEGIQTHSHSFALIPENDITVSQEVFTMGSPVSYDRAFAIEFVPAAEGETFSAGTVTYPVITAREGIDFELDSLFIPAGKVSGNVKLTFHRQKEMQDTFVKVRFRLVANENFIPCAADSSATQKILTPDFIYYVSDGEPSCPRSHLQL